MTEGKRSFRKRMFYVVMEARRSAVGTITKVNKWSELVNDKVHQ